ncbi:hypothetical protein GUA87_05530 [Sneathiella sp. P13V-1]|uniref:hypothetical protein n=1 Tax=Sneathiella sp. P13V-1 TaxID=2697366 RepID=UPI00187B6642|nr:hypothetical protein [Sneathiella sp. P13V-1]MBE7636296.1 hypothetical protein [Sneathiella sp. P13V-1]
MRSFAILAVGLFLTGCSNYTSYLHETEAAIGTESQATKIMHTSVDFPRGISLTMPGYVIGVEKAPRENVTTARWQISPRSLKQDHPRIAGAGARTYSRADAVYTDSKAHIITHVMKFDVQSSPISGYQRVKGCALYNLYEDDEAGAEIECQNHLPALPKKELKKAFDHSWNALDKFKESFLEQLSGDNAPTHVIVYVMGWNTPQIEAYRNFNSLAGHLIDAAEADKAKEFRPLIIGVTWPSLWRGVTLLPNFISQPVSYRNKADDADELGLTWLGALIHDVLPAVRDQVNREKGRYIPIITVGHSFGARAVSRAVFTGPTIARDPNNTPKHNRHRVADVMIGLQGAFSKNRFHPKNGEGREGQPYDQFRYQAGQTILTASRHDKAIDLGFWVDAAGNEESWDAECAGPEAANNPLFNCQNLLEREKFIPLLRSLPAKACQGNDPESCRIQYVRLDPIVRFNAAETGGGAHSDIYRAPIGQLTWEMIKKYAPGGEITRVPTN